MVSINCAALPESLAESLLFGYERGAFSGADRSHAGILEQSSGSTLFLDEVGELSMAIQAKLLRAIEQKRITRLGDSREREVDLRIVSATNRKLEDEVKAGRFREDLYYRLRGAEVGLPPLRDRLQELPLLASAFLSEACSRSNRAVPELSAAAMEVLSAHAWRGNVRELKTAMDWVAAMCTGPIVEPSHLPGTVHRPPPPAPGPEASPTERAAEVPAPAPVVPQEQLATEQPAQAPSHAIRFLKEELEELEERRIREALEAAGGVVARAAQLLGMSVRTLWFKLKRYKIR